VLSRPRATLLLCRERAAYGIPPTFGPVLRHDPVDAGADLALPFAWRGSDRRPQDARKMVAKDDERASVQPNEDA